MNSRVGWAFPAHAFSPVSIRRTRRCLARNTRQAAKPSLRGYPHRFLFVGRFHANKGLDVLCWARGKTYAEASSMIGDLTLIGNGPLEGMLKNSPRVTVKNFMQPEELAKESANAGVFVLPSRIEPWGVVVHEFAATGLPLVLSDACGAGTDFLVSGYNGLSFPSENIPELSRALASIVQMSDDALRRMGKRSFDLSRRNSPSLAAASLMVPLAKKNPRPARPAKIRGSDGSCHLSCFPRKHVDDVNYDSKPSFQMRERILTEFIGREVTQNSFWLDAGCGNGADSPGFWLREGADGFSGSTLPARWLP